MVNVHHAKTHLSRLLERVAAGEEIVIAKNGHPVARLVRVPQVRARRKPGLLKGKIRVSPDFDAPLPPRVLRSFAGDE
jgi:prevent-host-death family protein